MATSDSTYPAHYGLALLSHILYRDILLTLHPNTSLPPAFLDRLKNTYKWRTERASETKDFVSEIRKMIEKEREKENPNTFTVQNLSVCLSVATILFKLDTINAGERKFELDMKPRLEYRLGCVNLLESYDKEVEVMVWALDWRDLSEEIQGGLTGGQR
jgi:hypothetical protein